MSRMLDSLLGGSGTSKEKIKIKRDDKFNKTY